MQKITTFLWFNNNAEEAMNFYISIFKDSKIVQVSRNGKAGPGPEGSVLTGTFQIEGQQFMVLNGGPHYTFTPAISLFIGCDTQEEVDYYWDKFTAEGEVMQCGWVKDKFGLCWQVVPLQMGKYLYGGDPEKNAKAMRAMMQMKKLDLAALEAAYNS
jgi:predicted 3-demethylubiquinone-9 3-methyltransferase (glyoxalase superfamily)